jgi:hypothetical protein
MDENRASRPDRGQKGHIGWLVSGSIAAVDRNVPGALSKR